MEKFPLTEKRVCARCIQIHTHTFCFVQAAVSSLQVLLNTASDSKIPLPIIAIISLEKCLQIQIVGNTYEEKFLN